MRVVVIGAGVAGCIVARSLARVPGIDLTCLERVSADDHSESGTGLNIGPNAVRSLTALDPELARAITDAAFAWRDWKVSLVDGTVLFDVPLADVADNNGWRIRWSELYRVLRDRTPNIAYDCTITSCGPDEVDGRKIFVTWTQHGVERRLDGVDLLIAADGRYSQMRRLLSGEPAVRHVGVAISRLLVPDNSAGLIGDYEQWFNGPSRLLAFRVPPAHVYIACAFPIDPDRPIGDHFKQGATLRSLFTPSEGALTPQTQWIVDTVSHHAAEMHWARLQEHEALYAHPGMNVLYLGDSAHGMVPTLGQGATQAVEDACFASEALLTGLQQGPAELRSVLGYIDRIRTERVKFVMQFSLDATDAMLAGADTVTLTRHKTGPEFIAKLKRLFREIPPVELKHRENV
jgi:salicylate hydroxylase